MALWDLFADLGPYARVTTAVAPFAVAVVVRLLFGSSRVTAWLISASTMWFLVNVLLAPYSPGMRDDLEKIQSILR